MRAAVHDWLSTSTSTAADWQLDALLAAKEDQRVSVVLPARDEAATIGGIVARINDELVAPGLVDELVVMDSDSADDTAALAESAGATVFATHSVRPDLGSRPGKGEALWKSMFVTSGDVMVFIDADLTEWGTQFVTGLLGPLLTDPAVELVKGFYDRIVDDGSDRHSTEGGRVTELVARPVIDLWWPDLAGIVQPLAGEWAIRRSCLEFLAVPTGYGVEIATLLDVFRTEGLAAIAQVDLGARAHRHQSVHDLAVMAAEVMTAAAARSGVEPPEDDAALWQFTRDGGGSWRERHVPTEERPPVASVARSAVC
jgi:glucosyl-3-phosphoglycerate synthase